MVSSSLASSSVVAVVQMQILSLVTHFHLRTFQLVHRFTILSYIRVKADSWFVPLVTLLS